MAPGMRDSLSQGYWPLPSQQSEVQRLKEKNESLVAQLQNAKAMKEGSYYNWIGTYPQLMNLKAKNEELMKKLQDARQEIGHLKDENEHLKAKFSIPSKKASSKAILGVPTVTAKTSSSVMPAKTTNSSKKVDEFSTYGRDYTPAQASDELKSIIRGDLKEKSINSGTIYGFRGSSTSPLVKIGVTEDFSRRMAEHLRNDMANKHMVFKLESIHAGRVERLIHAHLRKQRRQLTRSKNVSGLEKRCHNEFFEVSDEMARSVAYGWRAWMACEPYMRVPTPQNLPEWKLKSEWNDKLNLFNDDRNGQNGWLEWLSLAVPGFVYDPISCLWTVPAVDIAPRVVPIFDDSYEVHLEVKREPDLDIHNSPATLEAAHIPAPITTSAAVEQAATEALIKFRFTPQVVAKPFLEGHDNRKLVL